MNPRFNTIDFGTAGGIICMIEGPNPPVFGAPDLSPGGPEFLDGHIAKWRERPIWRRCGRREVRHWDNRQSLFISRVFTHCMRSFVVDFNGTTEKGGPHTPGLKCLREYVTFQGFYDDEDSPPTKLVEKRFSIAVDTMPLEPPGGHFGLVSVCDGQNSVFGLDKNPSYELGAQQLWMIYGLQSASICTGISIFQLHICAFIDSWEQDWNTTLECINEKVTLKVS